MPRGAILRLICPWGYRRENSDNDNDDEKSEIHVGRRRAKFLGDKRWEYIYIKMEDKWAGFVNTVLKSRVGCEEV